MVKMDEVSVAASQTVTLPLADFDAGIVLDEHQYLHGGTVFALNNATEKAPLTILPWGNRFQTAREPSAYVMGTILYLRGLKADWTIYGSLELSYTPIAGTIDDDADALILPPTALAACVDACGAFMASRGHRDPALPPIDLAGLRASAAMSESDFLDDIFQHRSGRSNKVREVRSYS